MGWYGLGCMGSGVVGEARPRYGAGCSRCGPRRLCVTPGFPAWRPTARRSGRPSGVRRLAPVHGRYRRGRVSSPTAAAIGSPGGQPGSDARQGGDRAAPRHRNRSGRQRSGGGCHRAARSGAVREGRAKRAVRACPAQRVLAARVVCNGDDVSVRGASDLAGPTCLVGWPLLSGSRPASRIGKVPSSPRAGSGRFAAGSGTRAVEANPRNPANQQNTDSHPRHIGVPCVPGTSRRLTFCPAYMIDIPVTR